MGRTVTRKGITTLVAACAVAAIAPAAPAAAAPVPATAIVLERAGGFAGTRDSYAVDRSTAGGRLALRMAGSTQFRWLRGSYQPDNPCCDRYSYRLTVTYRGGRHKTISTVQGATAPRILWDVITEVERVGIRPATPPRTAFTPMARPKPSPAAGGAASVGGAAAEAGARTAGGVDAGR